MWNLRWVKFFTENEIFSDEGIIWVKVIPNYARVVYVGRTILRREILKNPNGDE